MSESAADTIPGQPLWVTGSGPAIETTTGWKAPRCRSTPRALGHGWTALELLEGVGVDAGQAKLPGGGDLGPDVVEDGL